MKIFRDVRPDRIVRGLIRRLFSYSGVGRVRDNVVFSNRFANQSHTGNVSYRIGPGEKYVKTQLVVCNGRIYLVMVK